MYLLYMPVLEFTTPINTEASQIPSEFIDVLMHVTTEVLLVALLV